MTKPEVTAYNGKKIVIMGLGKSTLALAKLLHGRGAVVRVSEINPKDHVADAARDLAALKPEVEAEFGKHSPQWFLEADLIVTAPGIRMDTKPLDEARAKGVEIISDLELLACEIPDTTKIVAIAGTTGKTTVAFLVRAFLESSRRSVFYSGDHGEPLANLFVKNLKPEVVLLEMSPFQLDNLQQLRPQIAVLTSLHPPFPERFPSPESYGGAMRNLLRQLDDKSALVYNFRDAGLKSLVVGNPAPKWVYRRKDPIGLGDEVARLYKGSWLGTSGRELIWKDTQGNRSVFNLRELRIFGTHNRDNLMAAVNVAKLLNVQDEVIQKVIDTFPGVPHRLEFVKKKGGVRLFNDSRATSVDMLRLSLDAFPLDPIILIAGGRDAQADFTQLADTVKTRVKTLILVGEAKEHINRCLGDHSETFLVGTFEEAVLLSYQKSREGDIILLAPGCESYDMFVSYEERGNYFKKYVEEI
jgi:UDP-N-acetylmuramoylalanine--D-glutamate ligase